MLGVGTRASRNNERTLADGNCIRITVPAVPFYLGMSADTLRCPPRGVRGREAVAFAIGCSPAQAWEQDKGPLRPKRKHGRLGCLPQPRSSCCPSEREGLRESEIRTINSPDWSEKRGL